MELLCDSHHGHYIPQIMAILLFDAGWTGFDLEKVAELDAGPYKCDWYWDTWNDILNNAQFKDENGVVWYLYYDGDLFAATETELENLEF